MMTVTTCGFHGIIRPSVPVPYTVRCLTCRAIVANGDDCVSLEAFTHDCTDTSATLREYEVTFETPMDEVELPLPLSAAE